MSIKISISGAAELDRTLKTFPKVMQNNILQNAHIAASRVMVDGAKALAPRGETGNLKRSIGVERVSIGLSGGTGVVQLGPRRGGGFKGYHGHLIEYGKTNRGGRDRSRAYPFMNMAFNARKSEVEKNIAFYVGKKVAEHIVRNVKR
jgi:hypothetical protein